MDFLNRVVKFRKGSTHSDGSKSPDAAGEGRAPVPGEAAYEEVDLGTNAGGPANYGAHASSPVVEMQKSLGANGETAAQGQCEGRHVAVL